MHLYDPQEALASSPASGYPLPNETKRKQPKQPHVLFSNALESFLLNVSSLHIFRYLYGFEEYCRSANIDFQMALPEKVLNKPCKDCENKEVKVKEESETEIKEVNVEDSKNVMPKEETPAEDESERKENIKPSLVTSYC
jgi:Zn finger protein HypA/HybF involved in hydrogenase expression